MNDISLCMIVKNEENNLPRCLESVKGVVDEIIIVDTGSNDRTIEIAKSFGAKVYNFQWINSFAKARNFSLSKATKEWIMIMDADDELLPEDKSLVKALLSRKDLKANIFFCETLSFVGEKFKENIVNNMNVRFFRNHKGYEFEGDIHEQIKPLPQDKNNPNAAMFAKIRFYHYGYLKENVISKNKRERNMEIIKTELDKNPNDGFVLFNMGSEYYASSDFENAIEYYEKAYKIFKGTDGYASRLLQRMITCYEFLKERDKEKEIIEVGIKIFPECTDFYFNKANIYKWENRYDLAILEYKRCLEIGEPPTKISDLYGVGTFRPATILSDIYFDLKLYDESLIYAEKALSFNDELKDLYYRVANILNAKGITEDELEEELIKSMGKFNGEKAVIMADIFYGRRLYSKAYEYVVKGLELETNNSKLMFYKGVCEFYLGQFDNSYKSLSEVGNEFIEKIFVYKVLTDIFSLNFQRAHQTLEEFRGKVIDEKIILYKKYIEIMENGEVAPITDREEESKSYIGPMFELLSTILMGNYFEEFKKSLALINTITSNEVLLLLGKLYYKHGLKKFAYDEIKRSIKVFDVIDIEGLNIMKEYLESQID